MRPQRYSKSNLPVPPKSPERSPAAKQAPGVRAPKLRSGGEQLNRGVIRGAKAGGTAPTYKDSNYGSRPGRGGVVRKREDDENTIESTYEEQVFTVNQEVVPGVIRGWSGQRPPKAGPASGARGGAQNSSFDDDDW